MSLEIFTPETSAQEALALVVGVVRVLRDSGTFNRDQLVAIFEQAVTVTKDGEAIELLTVLLKELVPEQQIRL